MFHRMLKKMNIKNDQVIKISCKKYVLRYCFTNKVYHLSCYIYFSNALPCNALQGHLP